MSAITPEVLAALNAGHMATVNLVEFLAIDLGLLARNVATSIGLNPHSTRLQETVATLAVFKPMQRHSHIARALYDMTVLHPHNAMPLQIGWPSTPATLPARGLATG